MNEKLILLRNFDRLFYESLLSLLANDFDVDIYEKVIKKDRCPVKLRERHLIIISNSLTLDMPFLNKKYNPGISHVVLINQAPPMLVLNFFYGGGKGVISSKEGMSVFFDCIHEIGEGRTFVSPLVSKKLAKSLERPDLIGSEVNHSVIKLTQREHEIINLIASGLRSKEIGTKLRITLRTVENHRHNILRKLGIRSVAELINFKKSYLP